MFNLFGAIPDILMGRKPKDALLGNTAAVSSALAGGNFFQGLQGAPGATNPALIESAMQTPGYGQSSASPMSAMGLLGDIGKFASPIGQAAQAAGSVQGLLGGQQQPAPMPVQLGATGDPIGQLLNSQQQEDMMRKQIMEKLQRRMYGGTL